MDSSTATSYVAGFFDGEGCINLTKNTINLLVSNTELHLLHFYQEALTELGFSMAIYNSTTAYSGRICGGRRACLRFLRTIPFQSAFKQAKTETIFRHFGETSFVPSTVTSPSAYLAGFFDAEGSISETNHWAEVSNMDYELMLRVQNIFAFLNITAKLQTWKTRFSTNAYRLRFREEDLVKILFQSPKHHERLYKEKRSSRGNFVTAEVYRELYRKGEL